MKMKCLRILMMTAIMCGFNVYTPAQSGQATGSHPSTPPPSPSKPIGQIPLPKQGGNPAPNPNPPPPPPPAPNPNLNSVQPPPDFLTAYDAFTALETQVQTLTKTLQALKQYKDLVTAQDTLSGMQIRISRGIPPGYTFDRNTKLFLPASTPANSQGAPATNPDGSRKGPNDYPGYHAPEPKE